MAAHLLILYPRPSDRPEFERVYHEEHLPLAGPMLIGATEVTTKRTIGPGLPDYHLISDVCFPTMEALLACAMSKGGQQALAHAAAISTGGEPLILAAMDDA
ncbi:EthD family reductase [Sphingomonas alba]|uniref:EthD family reductase n=1 Tax=Sphingomonas alba TaxID=2908208 RepID=A0ABT0RNE9_9SPHN|nr:EthD family reductase [Sphingomonas alba]MCL6684088.1 EthD family reductase [Sphingomonas alba]